MKSGEACCDKRAFDIYHDMEHCGQRYYMSTAIRFVIVQFDMALLRDGRSRGVINVSNNRQWPYPPLYLAC